MENAVYENLITTELLFCTSSAINLQLFNNGM